MNVTNYTYDGDNDILTMQAYQPNGTTSPNQTTAYVYGVGGTVGSNLFSKDLLSKVEYPDPTTGNASASASNDVSYTYDLKGTKLGMTDRNGTVHAYGYDVLGRLITDTVTTFGLGVDSVIGELGYSYNALGLPYKSVPFSSAPWSKGTEIG